MQDRNVKKSNLTKRLSPVLLASLVVGTTLITLFTLQKESLAKSKLNYSSDSSSAPSNLKTIETIAKSDYSTMFIAQAILDERCPEEYVYVQGETENYEVVICASKTGLPTHYMATSKKNGAGIFLPVSSHTSGRIVARNGNYFYILDSKKQTLTIRIPNRQPRVERFIVDIP